MTQKIEVIVKGGKATGGPPLGPALGPLGVNISDVVAEINKRTEGFAGMEVPVRIIVDEDKNIEIEVGTPPVSALIKKELGLEKMSPEPGKERVADLLIQQCIKIAKAKAGNLNTRDMFSAVKQVIGSCLSAGITVEGMDPREAIREIDAGRWKREIEQGITTLTKEQEEELAKKKEMLAAEVAKKREEERRRAKELAAGLAGKDIKEIKSRLREEGISDIVIKEVLEGGEAPQKGEKKK
jgi:large subunit ribosomal protein L11